MGHSEPVFDLLPPPEVPEMAAMMRIPRPRSEPGLAELARQLQTSGARFFVDDDSSFDAKGYGGARAYYDETANEIHLRRSVVQNPDPTELIGQIAHEGLAADLLADREIQERYCAV